jgi:hypothetical protein
MQNPIVILAAVGAFLLVLSIVGRVEAEKLKVGIAHPQSRIAAGVIGVICLGSSIYVQAFNQVHVLPKPFSPEDSPIVHKKPPEQINGSWRCTTESRLKIEWLMEAVPTQKDEIFFSGPKVLVDGNPADPVESICCLRLEGTRIDRVFKGEYTEIGRVAMSKGNFEVTFSEDFRSFQGAIYRPDKKIGSQFFGIRLR